MTTIAKFCAVAVESVTVSGSSDFGGATPIGNAGPHTMLLVDLQNSDLQAIKFAEGTPGDVVDVYVASAASTTVDARLAIYDHVGNSLMGTASGSPLAVGDFVSLTKVLESALASTGAGPQGAGTWLGTLPTIRRNYPATT